MSRILIDFQTAKISICVAGNLKIIVHFFFLLLYLSTETVNVHHWLRMARMKTGFNLKKLGKRFQVVSAGLRNIDIYSLSLISIPNKGYT